MGYASPQPPPPSPIPAEIERWSLAFITMMMSDLVSAVNIWEPFLNLVFVDHVLEFTLAIDGASLALVWMTSAEKLEICAYNLQYKYNIILNIHIPR